MRVAFCLVAFMIGYTYATTCTHNDHCDPAVTICDAHHTLTCLHNGVLNQCVCVADDGGAHVCTSAADCSAMHAHGDHHHVNTCRHHSHHWVCEHGHCHCRSN